MGLIYYDESFNPPPYKPGGEEKKTIDALKRRIDQLKIHRSALKANAYDPTKSARTLEKTWDMIDFNMLPHKYSDPKMKVWEAQDSKPMTYSKVMSAVGLLIEKNPEVQVFARSAKWESKKDLYSALYSYGWDRAECRGQLIRYVTDCAKYGFSVARRYHRFVKREIKEITLYDPEKLKHETEKGEMLEFDDPFFEVLPIKDCWFDDRAIPYFKDSLRDWFYVKKVDWATFKLDYPVDKYPNAKYIKPAKGDNRDQNEVNQSYDAYEIELYFYEDKESDTYLIYDYQNNVLLYEGPLPYDHKQLSCITAMWSYRHDYTIYGLGLVELMEGQQTLLDKVSLMRVNQVMLAITSPGFYGGQGNPSDKDLLIEVGKLKKLRDADKIVFLKIPPPDASSYKEEDIIKGDAGLYSGVTESLVGEKAGNTLGENILNREAGLRRMKLPLEHIEMALEHDAKLTIALFRQIYERPTMTQIVRQGKDKIVDQELWDEYMKSLNKGVTPDVEDKFPMDDKTGTIYRNKFRERRLSLEKNPQTNEMAPSDKANHVEITPSMIRGEFDVKIKAMSTVPLSKELIAQKKSQLFGQIAQLPNTDIMKAEKQLIRSSDERVEDWMKDEQQVQQEQQAADQQRQSENQQQDATQQPGPDGQPPQGGAPGGPPPPGQPPTQMGPPQGPPPPQAPSGREQLQGLPQGFPQIRK